MMDSIAWLSLILALIPTLLFLQDLCLYQSPKPITQPAHLPPISVLIPARNEELSIAAAVRAALASESVEIEVLVLDDHSEDATAAIVREIALSEPRLKLHSAPDLPSGWCGKQHACYVLAQLANYPLLAFIDADVRLNPAGLGRAAQFLESSGADLISGLPFQETGTFGEKLIIPLIHFVLLGFLPLARMRASLSPAYGAGCGQFFLVNRAAYNLSGGHLAIRTTLHDGLMLPRAFRQAGLKTDLCDATELATCRMYRGIHQVWQGLSKNAVEGMASPRLILPATLLLLIGQVVPTVLVALGLIGWIPPSTAELAFAATLICHLPRFISAARFRQSWFGAVLHPLGVGLFLAIQWYALACWALGLPSAWKGRNYVADKELAGGLRRTSL